MARWDDTRGGSARQARLRRWVASLTGGVLVLGGALAGSGAVATPLESAPVAEEKIQADVADELADRGRASVLLRFGDRPDLDSLAEIESWDERGQAVYDALRSTAERSQAGARAALDEAGVDYRPFFVSNAILVRGGDEPLVSELALDPEVEGVYLPTEYEVPEPEPGEPQFTADTTEWGVADINADDVWSSYGVTGEGLVVASIDSGVDHTHPALVEQYRGNNGDGTFTHDYNWFDASGSGSEAPVDDVGHGTHTMGTMVGSDGGSNQIGVAPGARWIAASPGAFLTDEALMASGEWLLAPTDLNGENPMPALRPHVINNSWGSGIPSDDPFMEDVALAWGASGIFGVWSNGNMGPGCTTSSAPGSRIINYSVGAHDVGSTVAEFSSRGAGQDGAVKPDISAPGVDVRSSVPGGGYDTFSGTSMSAPHVAGSVALLWSAAPDLIGDVALARELLDGSAIDTPDDTCGGTDGDNNVYGEGRLDALALLDTAPIGPTGRLDGTVTDAETAEPLGGATVVLEGERTRTITTTAEGTYGLLLGVGDWGVTTSKFGYLPDSATITVPEDQTVVHDVALQPAPTGVLTGTVTDGSGQGYPLYTRVSVDGAAGVGTYTDPETGSYSLTLPVGTHVVRATSQLPGYLSETQEVVVVEAGEGVGADFSLEVDSVSCTAPGYTLVEDGVAQSFDDPALPEGWTVEDLAGSGRTWEFTDPWGLPNMTGGNGGFAVANSGAYEEAAWDTVLVSPVVDLSAGENVTLGFKHFLDTFGTTVASAETSTDGTTWTPVWDASTPVFGEEVVLDLTGALGGETQAQVRFRYLAGWDLFWQVDDAFFGSRTCEPDGGGLVVGYVQDDVDGSGILNARVASVDDPGDTATTAATPDDPALEDGFYWLHSELVGTRPFVASARNYGTDEQDVTVVDGGVARADFVLGQAVLEVDPTSIQTTVPLGAADSASFTVTNTGTSGADITFTERRGGFEILRADGSTMTPQQVADAAGAPLVRYEVDDWFGASVPAARPDGATAPPRTAEEPWTDLPPLPVPLLDNRMVSLDGVWYSVAGDDGSQNFTDVYRYDAAALEWTPVAPLPAPAQSPVAAAVDGMIVVAGGWRGFGTVADTWLYDAGADAWSPGSPMPVPVASAGTAVVQGELLAVGGCTTGDCLPVTDAVQVYDPANDVWTQAEPAPSALAFPACGGVEGGVVCAGGIDQNGVETADTWLYDLLSQTWTPAAPAPVTVAASQHAAANGQLVVVGGIQDGGITNAAWSYHPADDVWSGLPNANVAAFRGGGACGFVRGGGLSGDGFILADVEMLPGYDVCDAAGADVDWLALDTTEAQLEPGESVTVGVTTDSASVNQPGTYTAGVGIVANVPVKVEPVAVTMDVTPPQTWGKVTGTAYLEDCEGGLVAGDSIGIDITPVREDVGDGWVIVTDQEGTYARWINTQLGTLRMTATLGGYRPDTHLVDLVRGGTVTQDFSLLSQECQENPEVVPPDVVRVAGLDRYDTAARVARQFDGADTVFVASGADFPDVLAAAARAGSLGGPVLLVTPTSVPDVTRAELDRLQPETVVVVGGTDAVSASVAEQLGELLPEATVERRGGADRYETAATLSRDLPSAEVVYVATGTDFPDGLTGAARAASGDSPVLLVRPDTLPSVTKAALDRLAPERIVVLGGASAVSETVATQLGAYGEVERVAGTDRYATAAEVSAALATSQDVYVATGLDWPDALAGAARAGATDAPVLLVRTSSVPASTWAALDRLEPGRIVVLGGPRAVSETVAEALGTPR